MHNVASSDAVPPHSAAPSDRATPDEGMAPSSCDADGITPLRTSDEAAPDNGTAPPSCDAGRIAPRDADSIVSRDAANPRSAMPSNAAPLRDIAKLK